MKNLMLFVHPSKDFLPEQKTAIKIEIDNNLSLGWKAEDIILATNFPYEYNGVKSLIVRDDNYHIDISPCASIINVIVELFERELIKPDELYWYHDTDLYQIDEITESELNLGKADIGLVVMGTRQKFSASSMFFKAGAKDIYALAKEVMYKYRVNEELAINAVATNNLLWATASQNEARERFAPLNLPGSENIPERVKKLNVTYDIEWDSLGRNYSLATKPLKVCHFHFRSDLSLDSALYGKNGLKQVLVPQGLVEIFNQHGVKGTFPKKMKNLMVYVSPEKKFPDATERLVKAQIDNSLKLGWKKEDIVLITNFQYEYQGIKSTVLDGQAGKANAIFYLLSQEIVKERELWWYHDLDVFQLKPIDSSQIDLEDMTAGFTEDSATHKLNFDSVFFRKDSNRIFEWTRNRACRLDTDEATALMSLASENYREINYRYVKLNLKPGLIARQEPNQDDCFCNYPPVESLGMDDTALKPPCRSPLVVIEVLRPYIEGKVVCDVGSALGDIALKMKKYAKHVFGIEIDEERVEYSKKRGLDIRKGDALDLLPLADKVDVYYMWMDFKLTRRIFDAIDHGVVIMAGELGYEPKKAGYARGIEVKVLDEIYAQNPGCKMLEVKYNEGGGDRQSGVWVLLIVEK